MEAKEVICPYEPTVMRPLDPPPRQTQTNALAMNGCSPWEVAQFRGVLNALKAPI